MAVFQTGYKITIYGNEGGWNPGIGENPTYEGIDHGMHPDWSGWPVIFAIIKQHPGASVHELNILFAQNASLQASVQAFYKTNFWDNLKLDQIHDQQIADNIFDSSVNPCIDSAGKVLQKAVNTAISSSGIKNITPLIEDGHPGPQTINAANSLPAKPLFDAINTIRKANYIKRVQLTPKDATWLHVWLNRLLEYK